MISFITRPLKQCIPLHLQGNTSRRTVTSSRQELSRQDEDLLLRTLRQSGVSSLNRPMMRTPSLPSSENESPRTSFSDGQQFLLSLGIITDGNLRPIPHNSLILPDYLVPFNNGRPIIFCV
uniref:C3 n=1 Tax=Bindweed mottle virus TaxID=3076663 RepID=A0AA96CAI7_9GEMI|nr:C3 [Bindweed mottle virus]